MKTKAVVAIVVFAALAIALNLSPLKIPAPYAPFLIYQIWEIPIVTAFLLYGARVGFLITVVNTVALMAFYPGALPTGPFYNCAAVLSMLLGVGMVKVLLEKRSPKHGVIVSASFTAAGVALRAGFMALLNYALLRFAPPVGYSLPEEAIVAMVPLVVLFNVTLALYTIPIGYSVARSINLYIKS